MTNEQIAWLAKNPTYRPLGTTGGFHIFTKRGTLKPDGTFVAATKRTPLDETGGAFGVGIPTDQRDLMKSAAHATPRGGFQTAAAAAKTPLPEDSRPNPAAMPAPGPLPKKV